MKKEPQYVELLSYSMPVMLFWIRVAGRHIILEIGIFGFCIYFDQNWTEVSIEAHVHFSQEVQPGLRAKPQWNNPGLCKGNFRKVGVGCPKS